MLDGTQFIDAIPKAQLSRAQKLTVSPGDYLIRAAEPVKFFYVLERGSAKLVHEDGSGELLIIDIYHAGDFFGEMEMVGVLTAGRSIIALTTCVVWRFDRTQFFEMWNGCPAVSNWILYVHCDRLLRAGDDKINAERTVLREKVFRIIQRHIGDTGCFLYTKQILAEMAGVSIRSLNRVLHELEDSKLISIIGGTIRLHME